METILKAIYFSTQKHINQKRKDGKTPYISHCLGVGLILSQVTKDKDIIVAGILHDTLEDTNTTKKEIEKEFGKKVANIVDECTEQNPNASWIDRKSAVLKRIPKITHKSALVKSADVLHNFSEIIKDVKTHGPSFFDNFNASALDKYNYEINRLRLLKKYHPNSLLKKIKKCLDGYRELIPKS